MGACCDGKPFGEPCGDCAFDEHPSEPTRGESVTLSEIAQGDADSARLDWGQRLARSEQGASDFWKGALSLDIANRGATGQMRSWVSSMRNELSGLAPHLGGRYRDAVSQMRPEFQGLGDMADDSWQWADPGEYPGGGTTIGDEADADDGEGEYGQDGPVSGGGLSEEKRKKEKEKIEKYKKKYPFLDNPSGKPPGGGGDGGLGVGPGDKEGENKVPGTKGGGRKSGCCVKTFDYPKGKLVKKLAETSIDVDGVGYRGLALHWRTEVAYVPKKEESSCACKCCTFRQFITDDYVALKKAPADPNEAKKKGGPGSWADANVRRPEGFEAGEDCRWEAYDPSVGLAGGYRDVQGTKRAPWSKPKLTGVPSAWRKTMERVYPLTGPFCYGRRRPFSEEEKKKIKRTSYRGHTEGFTECTYWATDTPKELLPTGYYFAWRIRFIGVIYDTCNGWAIRRIEDLPIDTRGYAGTASKGTGFITQN